MGRTLPHLTDPGALLRLLARVCRLGTPLDLRCRIHAKRCRIHAVSPEGLMVSLPPGDAEALKLRPGALVELRLADRGRVWNGVTTCREPREGGWMLAPPRMLACANPEAYLDHAPEAPLSGTYETVHHDIRDALFRGFAEDGLEFTGPQGPPEGLRLGLPLALSLHLGPRQSLVLQGTPAYLTDLVAGVRLLPESPGLAPYLAWIRERLHEDHARSLAETIEAAAPLLPPSPPSGHPPTSLLRLTDHAPQVLVVAEGRNLADHLAHSLGKKFGVAWLDWLDGPLRPLLEREPGRGPWGGFQLILVHQRLHLGSAFDLVRQLVETEGCPLPILLAASEEGLPVKRNRAIAAGAVDCLAVEPFHILHVMRGLEQTLRDCG